MAQFSRRIMLKGSIAAAAGAVLPWTGARAAGANERIRVAVLGFKWKGAEHIEVFNKIPGVQVAALCDVDPKILAREMDKLHKENLKADTLTDPRKLLDRKDIDAVVIATPNHWHALLAVWACQAGKDVYCEKPVCHNLWEGRQMVAAQKKYGRIVAAGTQSRSDTALRAATEYIHQGNLGKIQYIHALWFKKRDSIGKKAPWTPDWLDYDLWCGPSPLQPITRNELHYDWHWAWPTGNGDLGDLGVHVSDIARWFIGADALPRRVLSLGGRFVLDDAGQTPNTQLTIYDYPVPVIVENRNLPGKPGTDVMDAVRGIRTGVIVQCENGYYAGYQGGWIYDNAGKKIKQFPGDGGKTHQQNFVDAIRSRKQQDLRAPIEMGRQSTSCCLTGNISYRVGRPASPSDVRKSVEAFPLATAAFDSMEKHLHANKVDLAATPLTLGSWLTVEPKTETIVGVENGDAAKLNASLALTKDTYRAPYVMPENV